MSDVYQNIVDLIEIHQDDKAFMLCENLLKDNSEDIKALNLKGDIFFIDNEFQKSIEVYKKSYEIDIMNFDALKGIANSLFMMKNYYKALKFYEKALNINHKDAKLLHQFGKCLVEVKNFEKANIIFDKALKFDYQNYELLLIDKVDVLLRLNLKEKAYEYFNIALERYPNSQTLLCNYANFLFDKYDDFENAFSYYLKAIEIDKNQRLPRLMLSDMIYVLSLKNKEKAEEYSLKWHELDKENPLSEHNYQSITKKEIEAKPSIKYIEELFDNFSESFDRVLSSIHYDAPKKAHEMVVKFCEKKEGLLNILDVGCGTGWCGKYLKPYAKENGLTGIDLSEGMLNKAHEKNIYDNLIKSDMIEFMNNCEDCFDLMVSTDVIIYIGEVDALFVSANKSLKKGGLYIFSISKSDCDTFNLDNSGRYSHSKEYIKKSLSEAKFNIECIENCVIRMEFDKPDLGFIFVARKT